MAERQALLAKLLLQRGTRSASLNPGRQRHTVHLQHPVKALQIHAEDTRVAVWDRALHPADHAGTAAEGDHRGSRAPCPLQKVLDVLLAARMSDHVRGMVKAPAEGSDDVAVGATVRMQRAV